MHFHVYKKVLYRVMSRLNNIYFVIVVNLDNRGTHYLIQTEFGLCTLNIHQFTFYEISKNKSHFSIDVAPKLSKNL